MRVEARIVGQFTREVMVEIADRHAVAQQPRTRVAILVVRHVEHGDDVARPRVDPLEQLDVAFHAGHERAVHALRKPQLLKRAQPVRVAVEGKEVSCFVVVLHDPSLHRQGMKSPPFASSVAPVTAFA